MPDTNMPISVRLSEAERDLLETAAEQSRTNLSDFIRRRAIEAAELQLLDRRVVTIPNESWAKFEALARGPAKDMPALRRLAENRVAWED